MNKGDKMNEKDTLKLLFGAMMAISAAVGKDASEFIPMVERSGL